MSNAQWGNGFHAGKHQGYGLAVDRADDAAQQLEWLEIEWIIENMACLITGEAQEVNKQLIVRAMDKLYRYTNMLKRNYDSNQENAKNDL